MTKQRNQDQTEDPGRGRDLLDTLTDAQRMAVTHGTGPLLIVAGAGTGKTTVLTRRIEWLIASGRAKPAEILALTFTEKAAAEMEARLDLALPLGQADVAVHTFHSFGHRVLEEESIATGLPADFAVLNEPEQQIFLGDRLAALDLPDRQAGGLNHFRPLGNPFKFVEPIVKLISRAKDELVTPDQYRVYAEQRLAAASLDDERTEASRQVELAAIYAAYEQWKREAGVVDYGDLITRVVELIDRQQPIRDRLQQQFKYILVDEFQDTNVAQYELVKRLLGDDKNLTVVGDDDQAIYKFRGAAVSNILGFLDDFPSAKRVVLADNFRSTQPILDAAYRLIQQNNPDRLEPKLGISKHLTAHAWEHSLARRTSEVSESLTSEVEEASERVTETIGLEYLATEADEAARIVELVQARHAAGVPWHEIAILARSNTILEDLARVLAIAQIPFATSADRSFALRPEIRGVVAFLKVLAHPTDSLSLLKLALSPFFQADPDWLLVFNDAVRARHQSLHEVLGDESRPPWDRLPQPGRRLMLQLRNELARYRRLLPAHGVGDIVYQFLNDHGALQFDSLEDQTRIANLAVIFEAIRSWVRAGRDPHALAFVSELDQLVGGLKPPTDGEGERSAVQLLTVHAAKGLEFDSVILPSLIQGRFPAISRREALPLPDELITERLPTGDEHLEEERRLAYVAMTRAKRSLTLMAAATYGTGTRARKLSPFVAEALGIDRTPTPTTVAGSVRTSLFAIAPTTEFNQRLRYGEHDGVLTLSPAKIESYLRCPNEFYWRHVLQAPSPPTAVLVYGNAVHAGIETFHRLRKEGMADRKTLIAGAVDQFRASWQDEGFVTAKQAADLKVRGEATLGRFVQRNLTERQPTRVESWIHLTLSSKNGQLPVASDQRMTSESVTSAQIVRQGRTPTLETGNWKLETAPEAPDIAIRGRIDALWLGSEIEIRDYKTSESVNDEKKALVRAKANVPLLIYGYAIREETGRPPNRLTLDFVETDQLGIIEPTDEQLDAVAEVIRTVAADIRSGKFDPNPDPRHPCDVCRKP